MLLISLINTGLFENECYSSSLLYGREKSESLSYTGTYFAIVKHYNPVDYFILNILSRAREAESPLKPAGCRTDKSTLAL